MQTTVDEMGNEIVVVTKNKAPKKKPQKQGDGRVNDNQIATQVIEQFRYLVILLPLIICLTVPTSYQHLERELPNNQHDQILP